MFTPGVCGKLGNPSITSTSKMEKLADINPAHRYAWDIAIQVGIVLYPEGEIVSFIIQEQNSLPFSISSWQSKYTTLCSAKCVSLMVSVHG